MRQISDVITIEMFKIPPSNWWHGGNLTTKIGLGWPIYTFVSLKLTEKEFTSDK